MLSDPSVIVIFSSRKHFETKNRSYTEERGWSN